MKIQPKVQAVMLLLGLSSCALADLMSEKGTPYQEAVISVCEMLGTPVGDEQDQEEFRKVCVQGVVASGASQEELECLSGEGGEDCSAISRRDKDTPAGNPDAGEGAKARSEEGKVGKKDANMDKAKGNKVELSVAELNREIADNAGVLEAMADGSSLDGIFGDLGAEGTLMGASGLGSRGSGLGGGGTASGLGGTGTRGRGGGSSGFGTGQGNFGSKGAGGIGRIGGDPIILGALDKSLIDRVIKRNMNQIRYCYQRQLNASPTLNGKIIVKFVISGDGSVSQAKTHSSTMTGGGPVESCINSRFLRFKFPEPRGGGIVIVKYPFLFSPN